MARNVDNFVSRLTGLPRLENHYSLSFFDHFMTFSYRSISLVGEGERKLLKEIVKQARNPVKSRIVAPEIITKFSKKLREFDEDVQEILKQEREDKEV